MRPIAILTFAVYRLTVLGQDASGQFFPCILKRVNYLYTCLLCLNVKCLFVV